MSEYRCYSDASYDKGIAGYASIVTVLEDGFRRELHRRASRIKARSSVEAELYAIVVGLSQVPDDQKGIAWTDLQFIQTLFDGRRQWTVEYHGLVGQIQRELSRTGLEIDYMKRSARPHEYTDCHRMAYRHLRHGGRRVKISEVA